MSGNFWKKLKRPFFVLAPMYDVTDTAFRQMTVRHGRPDVLFTEFVSVDGLLHPKSQDKMIRYYLNFEESERPIVLQLWGTDPEKFQKAAALGCRLGFDGIDINMGCPDKKVIKAGAGAALINEPERAKEIICAAKDGAGDIPVSVKTRIGFDRDILESWLPRLLEAEPSAATIHARTMKQMSKVPARWDAVRRGAEIARETGIAIIGNGDVGSVAEGKRLAADTGADGVMVGRGALGNYWFFNDNKAEPGPRERLLAVAEHAGLFERNFSGVKNFQMMRKHFHAAASGFPGARELRQNLMRIQNASEAKNLINEFFKGEEVSYN